MLTTSVRFLLSIVSLSSTIFLLFLCPLFGISISALCRVLSLIIGNHRIFERCDDLIIAFFQKIIVFCCETACPHEIVLHGHVSALDFLAQRSDDRVIYISNHTAASDWIVAEFLALRAKALERLRFVLKNSLRYSPLYGWFLRQRNCIFVRRGAKEVDSFRRQIRRLGPGGLFRSGAWLVIFPEGTRIKDPITHPKLLASNRQYALKHDLAVYEYLLTPRHRGLELCVDGLMGRESENVIDLDENKNICWLLDATVIYEPAKNKGEWLWNSANSPQGYKRPRPASIVGLLTGSVNRIHVHLNLVALSENCPQFDSVTEKSYVVNIPPKDEKCFIKWLAQLYYAKDELLSRVYSSLQNNDDADNGFPLSFGKNVAVRRLARPIVETVPPAIFAYLVLVTFIIYAGLPNFIFMFFIASLISFVVLTVFSDDSNFW